MFKKVIGFVLVFILFMQCTGCASNKYRVIPEKLRLKNNEETEITLSDEAVDYFTTLWEETEWEPGRIKFTHTYTFVCSYTTVGYLEDFGYFYDFTNDRHCFVSEEKQQYVDEYLRALTEKGGA